MGYFLDILTSRMYHFGLSDFGILALSQGSMAHSNDTEEHGMKVLMLVIIDIIYISVGIGAYRIMKKIDSYYRKKEEAHET